MLYYRLMYLELCKWYAEGNKKFLRSYDANKLTSYMISQTLIMYIDDEILDQIDPTYYFHDTLTRCFLNINLGYTDELHDIHNSYWLPGEKIEIIK